MPPERTVKNMETKQAECSKHGLGEFRYHADKTNGGRWRCYSCQQEYSRNNVGRVRKLATQIKLERGCKKCGYNRFAPALHFAHKDDVEKELSPAQCRSVEKFLAEIEKCDVLCAVCHVEQDLGFQREGESHDHLPGQLREAITCQFS